MLRDNQKHFMKLLWRLFVTVIKAERRIWENWAEMTELIVIKSEEDTKSKLTTI